MRCRGDAVVQRAPRAPGGGRGRGSAVVAAASSPSTGDLRATSPSSSTSSSSDDSRDDGDRGGGDTENKLLLACVIGLATGLGVGVFNIAEHNVHDLVFLNLENSPERFAVEGARGMPDTWQQAVSAVAVPFAAGWLVTGLRFLADGFVGETPPRNPFGNGDRDDEGDNKGAPTAARARWNDALPRWAKAALKPTAKAAAAVITLGSGASLGPEGPSVEIGASVAGGVAGVADRVDPTAKTPREGGASASASSASSAAASTSAAASSTSAAERRLGLVAAGSAAGISAGFGAPIAGLFFAFESILQPAAARGGGGSSGGSTGFGPLTTESVILASVLAAVVSNQLLGEQPAFIVPAFEIANVAELPLYLPLGALCGATAVAFRVSSNVLGSAFDALERGGEGGNGEGGNGNGGGAWRVPKEFHAPLGGLLFGFVALAFPEVTYQGFDNVNSILGADGSALRQAYPAAVLLQLVIVKLLTTTWCRQSGLVGGVYAPSLFMGAALGSAYGTALVPFALAGAPVAPPQAYALVGMAGVLAGVCKVPLTAILLLFELTHDSRIIVPLLGTVGVAAAVSGAAERKMDVMRSERGKVQNDPVGRVARRGTLPGVDDDDDCVARDTCTLDEDDGGPLDATMDDRPPPTTAGREGLYLALEAFDAGGADADADAGEGEGDGEARSWSDGDAAAEILSSVLVADAMRRDAPRVSSDASVLDAALAAAAGGARDPSGEGGRRGGRCAVVVDPTDGAFVGLATASSLVAALERGDGGGRARDACDGGVPRVTSSASLRDALATMNAAGGAAVAAVVAAEGASALGVLERAAVETERDAASLRASLRAFEEKAGRSATREETNAPR